MLQHDTNLLPAALSCLPVQFCPAMLLCHAMPCSTHVSKQGRRWPPLHEYSTCYGCFVSCRMLLCAMPSTTIDRCDDITARGCETGRETGRERAGNIGVDPLLVHQSMRAAPQAAGHHHTGVPGTVPPWHYQYGTFKEAVAGCYSRRRFRKEWTSRESGHVLRKSCHVTPQVRFDPSLCCSLSVLAVSATCLLRVGLVACQRSCRCLFQ